MAVEQNRVYHSNPEVNSVILELVNDLRDMRKSYQNGGKRVPGIWGITLTGRRFREEVLQAIRDRGDELEFRYTEPRPDGVVFVRFSGGERGYDVDLDGLFARFNGEGQ